VLQFVLESANINIRKNESWKSPLCITFKKFKETSFCVARNFGTGRVIASSAYHFTYMGGADKVKNKIESFGEQSLNIDHFKNNIDFMIEICLSI
jgi:hypothetical protein